MSTLNNVGNVYLPSAHYGIITGTYSDVSTRIIDITVTKDDDSIKLPSFPTHPMSFGALIEEDGETTTVVGILGAKIDPDNSDQLIVRVDRGYLYEVEGSEQPAEYALPEEDGTLVLNSSYAFSKESARLAKGLNAVLVALSTYGIKWGLSDPYDTPFLVTASDPESLVVQVDCGIAILEDSTIVFSEPREIELVPGFAEEGQTGWKRIAEVFVYLHTGELGVSYGVPHATTPANPAATSSSLAVARILLTEGDTSIASGDITDCRPGQDPFVTDVAVNTGLTVDVTFSEPMGTGVTTASNYVLSGTGKGTLATNPNSVALVSGNKYRLTWTSGEMKDGGDIAVAVNSNVKDLAGDGVGSPNTDTDTGGAIGVAPTVSSVVVVNGTTIDVTFSEDVEQTTAETVTNYTVSGAGKGTFGNNPTTATRQGDTKVVRLVWSTGEMKNGEDVTVTVANVTDLAGNVVSGTVAGTDTGGGIGVAPTITLSNFVDSGADAGCTVDVEFSEAVTGATTAANYTLSGTAQNTLAATPNSAALVSGNKYVLTWTSGDPTVPGNFTITVATIADAAGNVCTDDDTLALT